MKLVGLTIARNEGWCLAASARTALRWVDAIVILDHASTDETPAIISDLEREFPGRVHRLEENGSTWHEMAHRQRTLDKGREIGGTHFAICDADEFVTANILSFRPFHPRLDIRQMVGLLEPGQVLQLPWIHCWRSLNLYRDDASVFSNSFVSLAFRDKPDLCWKLRDEDYDHHHRHPFNSTHLIPWRDKSLGGVLHTQHASWQRVLCKQQWYRMVEAVRWEHFGAKRINERYRPTTDETGAQFRRLPEEWWTPDVKLLDLNREPWQMEEMRRMIAEHGPEKFAGLDVLVKL